MPTASLDATSPERFGWHEDSYVVWREMHNQGWAGRDEGAARVRYSFKYTLCGPRYERRTGIGRPGGRLATQPSTDEASWCPTRPRWNQLEIFGAFTGEFDFYAGTRASGPVINRLSNPGLFLRAPLDVFGISPGKRTDSLEIGIEHRSNGQVTEVRSARDAERAELAYQTLDRGYFDTISRGSNFLSIAAWGDFTLNGWTGDQRVKLRLYTSQDSAITWGPLKGQGVKVSDYDRLQLDGSLKTSLGRWELRWLIGDKLLKTDSWVLGWQHESEKGLPIYVRIHLGPMNTLSNYTQKQNSVGIGLRFTKL